jgi:hypothetical protein
VLHYTRTFRNVKRLFSLFSLNSFEIGGPCRYCPDLIPLCRRLHSLVCHRAMFSCWVRPTPSETRNAITTPTRNLEPVKGIEPPSQLYESRIMPLYDTGKSGAEARYCPVFSCLQDKRITLYASSALRVNLTHPLCLSRLVSWIHINPKPRVLKRRQSLGIFPCHRRESQIQTKFVYLKYFSTICSRLEYLH